MLGRIHGVTFRGISGGTLRRIVELGTSRGILGSPLERTIVEELVKEFLELLLWKGSIGLLENFQKKFSEEIPQKFLEERLEKFWRFFLEEFTEELLEEFPKELPEEFFEKLVMEFLEKLLWEFIEMLSSS